MEQYPHINIETIDFNLLDSDCIIEPTHFLHLNPLHYRFGHFLIDYETNELFGYWLEHMRRKLYGALCNVPFLIRQPIQIEFDDKLEIIHPDLENGLYEVVLCFDKALYKDDVFTIVYSVNSITSM